jgi:hypothetical protein
MNIKWYRKNASKKEEGSKSLIQHGAPYYSMTKKKRDENKYTHIGKHRDFYLSNKIWKYYILLSTYLQHSA